MKKNVLVFGLFSGLIVTAVMLVSVTIGCNNPDGNETGSMLLGYASMLVAGAFIFIGIKNYRDKYNGGAITFGKAFQVGFYIALISATMYVLAWLIAYYFFIPDFMDKYVAHTIKQLKDSGASLADINAKKESMSFYIKMYKSIFGIILLTYLEILPVNLIITLIAALILKRRTPQLATA